ncbi:MAG: prephenate dehydrogenase [Actinomycetota bacterium]|nr:prephenate dehydrogenase [Actinomycetota bacterium]
MEGPIGVVGTGLIGTSIALAAIRLGHPVLGYDVDAAVLDKAAARAGLQPASSAEACARDASIVFVCTPVPSIPQVVVECLSANARALVTDAGSVKSQVVVDVEARAGGEMAARFVAGHPMAGSERSGPEHASAAIFDGATWILTPRDARSSHVLRLSEWIRATGARPMIMDADRHDRLVAVVSHLPQVVSSALMALAAREHALDPDLLDLSAGGFRDLTRLASSSPGLWTDILRANRQAVVPALTRFVEAVDEVRTALEADDAESVEAVLSEGRRARQSLSAKPQVWAGVAVLQVAIPDRPGALATLTGALARGDVNIEDLQIVHSVEGGRGTAHLTVAAERAEQAAEALSSEGFEPVRLA